MRIDLVGELLVWINARLLPFFFCLSGAFVECDFANISSNHFIRELKYSPTTFSFNMKPYAIAEVVAATPFNKP